MSTASGLHLVGAAMAAAMTPCSEDTAETAWLACYIGFGGAVMWNAVPYSLKSRRPPTEPVASKRSG
jgi:hypothetical protein